MPFVHFLQSNLWEAASQWRHQKSPLSESGCLIKSYFHTNGHLACPYLWLGFKIDDAKSR